MHRARTTRLPSAASEPRRRGSLLPRVALTGLLAVLALASCARPIPLAVSVAEEQRARWESLVALHPLPEEVRIDVGTPAPEGAARVSLDRVTAPLIQPLAPAAGRVGRAVLERRWLAPATTLWSPLRDASVDNPEAPLLPLAEIAPPLRALPSGGLTVADRDYPHVEQTVLTLDLGRVDLPPDDERLAGLLSWFARVAEAAQLAAPPALSWIAAAGDLMVARGVTELLDRPDGLGRVFSDVLPLMQEADYLLGNLEGAVTTRGTAWPKTFTFRFHPRVLDPLARAGFDYFSLVNNHSWDYGLTGFLDSLDHLAASGIATSGVGRTLAEARLPHRPLVPALHADGAAATPLSILSVGAYPVERSGFDGARETAAGADRPGVLWADRRNPEAQRDAFDAMRDSFGPDTYDIVSVHGGFEWVTEPSQAQRELYRAFIDAGADLVLGHHSHVVQGMEAYAGGLIVYSLGNFVFPGMFLTEHGEESVLLRLGLVDGRPLYVDPVPVRINHQLLSLDPDGPLLPRILPATRALNADADGVELRLAAGR